MTPNPNASESILAGSPDSPDSPDSLETEVDLTTQLHVVELCCEIVERRLTWLQSTPPETPALVPVALRELASLGIEHSRLCAQRAELERELAIAAGVCDASDAPN